jgi:hypothetical protein
VKTWALVIATKGGGGGRAHYLLLFYSKLFINK